MKFLARTFFRWAFAPVVWSIYRMRRIGTENFPRKGGVLLLSNHVSYIDAFVLYLTCPRPVRFVILESYMEVGAIAWFLRLFGAIPIRQDHAKEAIVRTVEALEAGDVVCLFPEGGLTRVGVTTEFKKGFEIIVRKAGCPVVPVYMDGLFESIFSYERERYFKKWPRGLSCPLQVAYGPPIPPDEATVERVRLAVWEQSAIAFERRRELRQTLEVALVRALKRRRRAPLYVEYARSGKREWTRAQTLALAVSVARRWMAGTEGKGDRIGILLPPGPMTAALNLGLHLAGKTPVNLPFTLDPAEIEAVAKGIAPLGIRTVITSRAFMPHLMDFWQGDEGSFIDMKAVLPPSGSPMALFEKARAMFEPTWMTCWRLDLSQRNPDREAVGLIPAPGEAPAFLGSRDLLRETLRVHAANFVRPGEVVASEDPLSHPAGLLLACWGPALTGGRSVGRSFSLRDDDALLAEALREQEATVAVGSAAWYQSIGAPPEALTLRYGLVFGEVDAAELREIERRLALPLARAWAYAGRVVGMSRPDPVIEDLERHLVQKGRDAESVGRFLPGIVAKTEGPRLLLRFRPWQHGEGWTAGPSGARIDAEGFLHLAGKDGD